MIVLDTHAWVWWVNDPRALSAPARRAVQAAVEERSVHVSSISAWEVALLAKRGRLDLALPVEDWLERCEALPFLQFVPVNNRIAVRSTQFGSAVPPDPADRIIAATALVLGATLVTRDARLRAAPELRTLW